MAWFQLKIHGRINLKRNIKYKQKNIKRKSQKSYKRKSGDGYLVEHNYWYKVFF